MDFSFRKKDRIRKKKEFEKIFRNGKKVFGKYLYLYLLNNHENPKLGFIINKKKRNGVERNRLKRQLKEIFRQNKPRFNKYSVVVGVKTGYNDLKYSALESDLLGVMEREHA